jgi:hypothetical protein
MALVGFGQGEGLYMMMMWMWNVERSFDDNRRGWRRENFMDAGEAVPFVFVLGSTIGREGRSCLGMQSVARPMRTTCSFTDAL